jgi:hypothetical protein
MPLRSLCVLLAREARTFYPGRIRSSQASIVGSKSFSTASAKPSAGRPIDRRIMCAPCRASATRSMRHRRHTIDVVESASRSHPPKIPIVIFSKTSSKARSKGPKSGLDSCRCRNEAIRDGDVLALPNRSLWSSGHLLMSSGHLLIRMSSVGFWQRITNLLPTVPVPRGSPSWGM